MNFCSQGLTGITVHSTTPQHKFPFLHRIRYQNESHEGCSPSVPPALRQTARMNWTDSWQCLPDHRKYQERGHLPQKWSQEICLLLLVYDLQQGSCCMCPGSNRKCQGCRDCRALFWAVSLLHPPGVTAVSIAYVSRANFWTSLNADAITRCCARSFRVEQKVFPSCGQRTLEKATNDTKILKVPKMVFMICLINPGKPGLNFYNTSKKQAACLSGVTKYVQSVR